jgi:hypothetical protein
MMVRELIALHGAWFLSALTILVTIATGMKNKNAWALGLTSQALWLLWIWATKQWGLLPLTFVLIVLYARNHVLWNRAEAERDVNAGVDKGWIVGNAEANLWRCWDCGPAWTPDPDKALMFMRRQDAEEFCAEDEDAWRVVRSAFLLKPGEVEARRSAQVMMVPPARFLGQSFTAIPAPSGRRAPQA